MTAIHLDLCTCIKVQCTSRRESVCERETEGRGGSRGRERQTKREGVGEREEGEGPIVLYGLEFSSPWSYL